MSTFAETDYDVIIIGGGMVGASLACVLHKGVGSLHLASPLVSPAIKIGLIEASSIDAKKKPAQPSFDSRSTVLAHGTVEYLAELGIWDSLLGYAEKIKKIHVSDQGRFGSVRMDSEEQGVSALGYVLENQALGLALNNQLLAAKDSGKNSIDIYSSAEVVEVLPVSDGMSVQLKQKGKEQVIKTKLVVMAEGGRSGLSEKMGIFRNKQAYGQNAIIANVGFDLAHQNIAYERFTPNGPLALLPLPDLDGEHRAALVWTQPEEKANAILGLDDSEFLKALQLEFGSRLGSFNKVGNRACYPLRLELAEEQVRHGLVLLGNVAHSLHPVAGQGFNLAFRDAMHLARNILESCGRGESPGLARNLQKYTQETDNDQMLTIAFSHYMTTLFSSQNNVLKSIRKVGVLGIEMLPALKKTLARQAMGYGNEKVKI